MSDDYFEVSRKAQLNAWIANQMLRGAGYAAALVVGFGLILALIWFLGTLLPAESRETPDPNTWSGLAWPAVRALV